MGTFRLGEKIGTGGMATVFLAVQEGPGGFEKHVAFKRLHGWVLDDDRVADSFLKEARLAAALNHPNIVSTLDVGREQDSAYIVMEYLRGETVSFVLSSMNGQGTSIPVPIACQVTSQVAAALHYAHTLRGPDGRIAPIVHRDVSPSNIIICYNGMVKLLDFGIATRPDEDGPRSEILKGKTDHLAPEQLMGSHGDPRSDVFQLGIVLWEMLTSRRLFGGATDADRMRAVLERDIPPPSQFNPEVSAEIDVIVGEALHRDPELRCSAEMLHERLDAAVSPPVGPRELRAWLTDTFPRREDHWIQVEQEVAAMAPSLSADRVGAYPSGEPATSERSLWVMVAGSSLFATLALALALFAVVYLYQTEPRDPAAGRAAPVAPATVTPTEAAAPPVALPEPPPPAPVRAPPPEPEPAPPEAVVSEAEEEAAGVEEELRPRFDEVPEPELERRDAPAPAPEPAPTAEDPDEAWRIDETEEIIDPFATGE